jgi:glutamate dehydrogenase
MSSPRTQAAPASAIDMDVFLHRYLAHAGSQLPTRTGSELTALARSHLDFASVRRYGETLVRRTNVSEEITAFEVVSADAPYLIDSVRAEMARSGHDIEQLLHPQMVVARDESGRLQRVYDLDDAADVPRGAIIESWMHLEVSGVSDEDAQAIVADLSRVLADVHYWAADAKEMYALLRSLADQLSADPGQFDRETSEEAAELMRWLAAGNYLILGHASYSALDLIGSRAKGRHARGVLRGPVEISPKELLPAFRSGAPVVIFKSPLVSTVRRSARYDCVTVLAPGGPNDTPTGQRLHVFLGLIAGSEDNQVMRVPVVRRRIAEILLRSGVRTDSHTGRQLMAALRTLPRDELLEAPTGDLLRLSQLVVDRAEHTGVGVFARVHLNRDFVTVLVYFPADRFGPETRRRVCETIGRHWPGDVVARDDRIVELGLARMQFLIALRAGTQPPDVDRRAVETEVATIIRRWSDDLADLLTVGRGEDAAARLMRRYSSAFPEAYKEHFLPAAAVRDIDRLEQLDEDDGLTFDMYTPNAHDGADRRLKVFRTGRAVTLARALPLFTQMGIEVLDERPYEIVRAGSPITWIYDFGLRLPAGAQLDEAGTENVLDTLRLLWRGELEQDRFNALVVQAGLTWWQVNVLRAYAKYLRQTGAMFSQGYIEQALIDNPSIAGKLVELFESRFAPALAGTAQVDAGGATLIGRVERELAAVPSLDQDRILRSILMLVTATLRTNAYRHDPHGNRRTALAIKLDPRRIPDLPSPRPRYEIWVYSTRVEGVHLRFGPVARGGIRWSDRKEDFRTEILGLVKAQTVKNAVIVPTGAKGGFIAKQLPDAATNRDAWLAEGIACYRTFVSCLLDLTDNYGPDGKLVPPPQTRCYDGADPYLVVAADKGTAKFSDIANAISASYGFWLGDAFASGGSVGYNHKAMGITARGAWESVKYHFRELGLDTQTQDFTVAGIGDMSGDVFGNGMLLSEHIRLVAAFDHRHVFLDPDPDPARSYVERRRLYDLSGSSWADYDSALISSGGGVYPRDAKAIPITPEVARVLDLPDGTEVLTPAEVIRAILLAPVDLLFNGGVGTYVKASTESHAAAGDKANDAVRVDGADLRCRVVGEGGNLGFTQRGRIEFARNGGQINTDAIDNSAGVDMSDHEVNLKILLDRAVGAGTIDHAERDKLLGAVADDVARLVLRDNYDQNVLLGMARMLSARLISVHERFVKALERSGELQRDLESLPTDREFVQREAAGEGLCSPENAVLSAYSKISLKDHIIDSTLPDEGYFQATLQRYFPPLIAERFAAELADHPLRREIITTGVVNDMINRSGTTFVHRATEETGVDQAQITRAYAIVREVFGLPRLWRDIEALDNRAPTKAQHAGYQEIRRLIDRATRWLVEMRFPIDNVAGEIERYRPVVSKLSRRVPDLMRGAERENLNREIDRLVAVGLPRELAGRIGELLNAYQLLDVVEIAIANGGSPEQIAELHFALSERFCVDEMLNKVTELPRDDRWSTLARAATRHDVYTALSSITSAVLRSTPGDASTDDRIAMWERANAERVERTKSTVQEALARERVDLATLSVALRVMRALPS